MAQIVGWWSADQMKSPARHHAALMQLLRERSQEQTRYSAQEVRERLGRNKPSKPGE